MPTDIAGISEVNGASLPQSADDYILEFYGLDDEDQQGVKTLREYFQYHPDELRDIWSMSRQALKKLIETAYHEGEIPVNKVCLDEMLRLLHNDLAGDNPAPLERLVIESLMFSWLAYWCAANAYERKRDRLSAKQDAFYQQRVNRWHRRFLADVRALAQLRKIGFPNVQINVADKQIVAS